MSANDLRMSANDLLRAASKRPLSSKEVMRLQRLIGTAKKRDLEANVVRRRYRDALEENAAMRKAVADSIRHLAYPNGRLGDHLPFQFCEVCLVVGFDDDTFFECPRCETTLCREHSRGRRQCDQDMCGGCEDCCECLFYGGAGCSTTCKCSTAP